MKKELLEDVVGKSILEAEELVKRFGYKVLLVPEECVAMPSIALGNTVVLWQNAGKVRCAEAGDPLELE